MNNLRIIPVVNEELVYSLCAVSEELLETPFLPETICTDISNDFEYFLLSYDYTFAGFSKIFTSDNRLQIDTIHIHEDFRKKGVFSSLLKNYIELCHLRNLSKIVLTCSRNNQNAINCFLHLGFKETHKEVSVSPTILMELSI
ncbi:GNAT family N-acetyltransferase [Faecalimonas sp.]